MQKHKLGCIITEILKTRILFVCLGNICRSPMAEGLFLHLLKTKYPKLENKFEVDSAGTASYHTGELPDLRMRETALNHGIELIARARTVTSTDLNYYDYIVAMDQSNQRDIELLLKPPYKAQIVLMRDYEEQPIDKNVPDPYFGGKSGFEEVYQLLSRCNTRFLNELIMRP
jgi:low molecular weight protein-tyrosine phosphatase